MKKRIVVLGLIMCLILTACSKDTGSKESTESVETSGTAEENQHASTSTVMLEEGEYNEEELDDSWSEENATTIHLTGDSADIDGSGVTTSGSAISISSAGTYVLSGELSDGRIIVNVTEGGVRLVLNGVSITSMDFAAIDIQQGDTIITLADGTINSVSDSEAEAENIERNNAAIYAKDDLVFNGTGSLQVVGSYKNAIQCKDKLKFISGTYNISASNHGLVGKDCIMIRNGEFTITSGSDGMQATNIEESDKGYIIIDGGSFDIISGTDGIQAETLLRINAGDYNIVSGGGSGAAEQSSENEGMPGEGRRGGGPGGSDQMDMDETTEDTASTKGLKSYVDLVIADGELSIDACDDAVHSNDTVTVNGGSLMISTGDDGLHADNELVINDGAITIDTSYEGLEGYTVTINGGNIDLKATDDGINAAQASSETNGKEPRMGESQGAVLEINGGEINVNASGDGIDANGQITVCGGTLTVQGPVMGGNGTFDFDEDLIITGGSILSVGTPSMAQTASADSTQGFITGTFDSTIAVGTTLTVSDESGNELLSFETEKESSWFMFSASELEKGSSYTVSAGDIEMAVTAE